MTIWFDMDGTIADLYGVDNWLSKLRNYDSSPYEEAVPLIKFCHFARILHKLQQKGHNIGILSWLSKDKDTHYAELVEIAKREWLAKHLPSVEWDNIVIIPYGTPKENYCKCFEDILFDDELQNRANWLSKGGIAFDEKNIVKILKKVLTNDCLYDIIE